MKKFKGFVVPRVSDGEELSCSNLMLKCRQTSKRWICKKCILLSGDANARKALSEYIKFGDLTKIDTPFGLCPDYVQDGLKKAYNRGNNCKSNILRYGQEGCWERTTLSHNFDDAFTYRLAGVKRERRNERNKI